MNSVSARQLAKCLIFGFFPKFGGRRRRNEKVYWPVCLCAEKTPKLFFRADILPRLSAAHNMSKYKRNLYQQVIGRNVRFSDFSPSSAVDVIGQIVLALIVIRTVFSIGLFSIIVCCLQHVKILTNSVSARHRAKCLIFGVFVQFGGRRRRNEEAYWPDCFSAKRYQNCYF